MLPRLKRVSVSIVSTGKKNPENFNFFVNKGKSTLGTFFTLATTNLNRNVVRF